MSIPPMPLSPDDEQQDNLRLSGDASEGQPYLPTAVLSALVLLLCVHGISFRISPFTLLLIGLACALAVYLGLRELRLDLPARPLSVVAAEVGLLYSLPVMIVYDAWSSLPRFLVLIWSMVLAGILGWLLGIWLDADERPHLVLPISFLALFVLVGFLRL